ncbi:hypothetical protein [uncultured Methylobacterium sp.]|uniref:hypothetical protein n=1 Tax=uncultured Methylobacterium sp. TaxID=157278 RepID=UPI0035CAA05E
MMGSIGGALAAASSLLGIRTAHAEPQVPPGFQVPSQASSQPPSVFAEVDTMPAHPARGFLAPGDPCFEAVAEALVQAGYLDS